ncbi:hypothetical protein N2152v2_003760 [Parachlorella kessleri]
MDRRRQRGSAPKSDEGELLSPKALAFTWVALVVTVTLMVAGILGVLVLLDESSEQPDGVRRFRFVSDTQFAALWRKMTEKNPFFTTIFVNGGAVTSVFFVRKLYEHRKALQVQAKRHKLAKAKKKE